MTERALGRAVFFDRDGTIIEDVGYPRDPRDIHLLPGAVEGLRLLQDAGLLLVIISNQSGIGRGLLTTDDLKRVHQRLIEMFSDDGITFDGAYYCPHSPDEPCECRKPLPGLLLAAAEELHIDLARSFMVGDKASDVMAGRTAGCRTALIRESKPKAITVEEDTGKPDIIVPNMLAASRWILSQLEQ